MLSRSHDPGRRDFLKLAGGGALSSALMAGIPARGDASPAAPSGGLPPLKITDVRVIVTCPDRNYVLVKILTSEPGLYGVGDATLNGRELAVATILEKHIVPLLIGRDPEQIEDTWQYLYRGSYWRGGPVQMTALAGVDLALWDIKGKRAGMPGYQLLGGRTRRGALAYTHASGKDFAEVEDAARRALARGFKCVRAQVAIPGLEGTYGTSARKKSEATAGRVDQQSGLPETESFEPGPYLRIVPKLFEHLRSTLGDEVELLHDTHEKLAPIEAARLAKELEPYHLFFLEDLLRPEHKESFRLIRQHSTTPLAMGELFNSLWDCVPLITEQLIDYIRCDLGHIGGITAGRKVASLAEAFHVKTAWHGPGDIGPPTHAANVHVDISIPNFGVQEMVFFPEVTREVLPGGPTFKEGYMDVDDTPGLGTDVNEELAKKYPYRRAYLPTARRNFSNQYDLMVCRQVRHFVLGLICLLTRQYRCRTHKQTGIPSRGTMKNPALTAVLLILPLLVPVRLGNSQSCYTNCSLWPKRSYVTSLVFNDAYCHIRRCCVDVWYCKWSGYCYTKKCCSIAAPEEASMDRPVSWTGAVVVPVLAFFVLPQQAATEGAPKWTPFVAKQSVRTYEITSAGKRCTSEKAGIYMQDSHGSTYTRTIAVSGDFGGEADEGVLDDAATGITCTIDYSRKQARVTRRPPPGPFKPRRPETGDFLKQYTEDQVLGKRTISGVECLGFKVPVMGSDEVAETWLAPSLNFFPVLARMHPAPRVELVILLEGIRVGEEPDAQFFRIPEGFTVVE